MIGDSRFPVEPWTVRETELNLDLIAQGESVFALGNGHVGLRGNLDEGEPHGIPGTYLAGMHEVRPLPYAEAGYGYPESGQSIVDVTNGKILRLLVDDEPLDVRYGDLHRHERVLDLRAGTLTRELDWSSPSGRRVSVRSTRLVSFTHRAVAAICYEVTAAADDTRVIVQSELVANEPQPTASADPRTAAAMDGALEAVDQDSSECGAVLLHRTRASHLLVGAGCDHTAEAPGPVTLEQDTREDWARTTVATTLQRGQTLRVVKFLAYGWSAQRSAPAVRDQVAAALTGARITGWDGLVQAQQEWLAEFWAGADVEVSGDPALQQAVRFGLFHLVQASARTERRAIGSKGLTGPGYDGHAFWDTEGFVLPVLSATHPQSVRDALLWRHSILPAARERAAVLGLKGAAFPWRTIDGQECSSYWPAGTAAFHVNADIAYAVERYHAATGDEEFDSTAGIELLVETARLWASLGHHDRHGVWHLDGVTGPDEYSAVTDDNVFTNLLAARNLTAAARACDRHPRRARDLGVSAEEQASWLEAATAVAVPYDEELGVHEQSRGFTVYREWDYTDAEFPLFLHAPYFELYRSQVCKQADLLLAMHWCGESFSSEQKARNVDYYERRTVRDSSLSAGTQAVMCAETGHLELALAYTREAAFVDLHDLHSNSRDGMHLASLAGAWTALVEGFGGMREHQGTLCFDPVLPPGLNELTFHLRWQGVVLHVCVTPQEVTYSCTGGALVLHLDGEDVPVGDGAEVARPLVPRVPLLPTPQQPPGRSPLEVSQGR